MKFAAKLQRLVLLAAALLTGGTFAAAQQACFQSVEAAVKSSGPQDANGFRLQSVTRSTIDGSTWAHVRSCSHPEWPLRLAHAAADTPFPQSIKQTALQAPFILMHAGTPVTVVSVADSIRLQIAGTAIEGGALGQRVRVRIATEGEERFIAGVVKTADTLEMVR